MMSITRFVEGTTGPVAVVGVLNIGTSPLHPAGTLQEGDEPRFACQVMQQVIDEETHRASDTHRGTAKVGFTESGEPGQINAKALVEATGLTKGIHRVICKIPLYDPDGQGYFDKAELLFEVV